MPNSADVLTKNGVDGEGPSRRLSRSESSGAPAAAPAAASAARTRRKVVIFRLGSLGDTVIALPCFHKIAQAYPDAERVVLTNAPISSKAASIELILGGSGLIDGVMNYPLKLRSLPALWRLSRQLRALDADALVYLTARLSRLQVLRDMLFFRLSGVKRVVGAPLAADVQVAACDADGQLEKECVRLARSMRALGPIDLEDGRNWDLRLTAAEVEAGEGALAPFGDKPFVAVNMGGKAVENHWGDENWRRFFADLASTHGGYGLLFVGAAEEGVAVAAVSRGWPSPVVNACGKLRPRESAAAMRAASLFTGHDSGPMHLAAAMGVTCVSPFSGLNPPRKWHPFGESHRIIHRMEGVDKIRVEEMTREFRAALSGAAPA